MEEPNASLIPASVLISLGVLFGIVIGIPTFLTLKHVDVSSNQAKFFGTFAGSMIGLIAVMVGNLYNAHLMEKRDVAQREQERIALAAALINEVVALSRECKMHCMKLNIAEEHARECAVVEAPVLNLEPFYVYQNVSDKIGLFDITLATKIGRYYGFMKALNSSIPTGRYTYDQIEVLWRPIHTALDLAIERGTDLASNLGKVAHAEYGFSDDLWEAMIGSGHS
jgi:hypothetical protein